MNQQSKTLKPCPFGIPGVKHKVGIECIQPLMPASAADDVRFIPRCTCGARLGEFKNKEEAINAWNSRSIVVKH